MGQRERGGGREGEQRRYEKHAAGVICVLCECCVCSCICFFSVCVCDVCVCGVLAVCAVLSILHVRHAYI